MSSMQSESTPELKIRGKRIRRSRGPSSPNSGVSRSRGRPIKPASELAASRKQQRLYLQRSKPKGHNLSSAGAAPQHKSQRSRLENLPVELTTQIFLHCLEVNMVKSSPLIAKSLSTESLFNLLILFAFFDDDEQLPVETKHFRPATYRRLPTDEKVRLQESILDCRWCTLQRISNCMPILCRLKMVQHWHRQHNIERLWETMVPPPEWSTSCVTTPDFPPLDDNVGLESYYRAKAGRRHKPLDFGEDDYLPQIWTWRLGISKDGKKHRSPPYGIGASILAVRCIPDRLLQVRSWTEENLKFLRLLRQGHRWIQSDFLLKISAQALINGMRTAIEECNTSALLVLLELHQAAFRLDAFTVDDQSEFDQHYLTTPIPLSLPLELFHLASKIESTSSSDLIALLIRGSVDSIPKDDAILTRWAIREKERNSTVAGWLLRYMDGSEDYGMGGKNSALFVNGGVQYSQRREEYTFSEKSFAVEIGYECADPFAFIPQDPNGGEGV